MKKLFQNRLSLEALMSYMKHHKECFQYNAKLLFKNPMKLFLIIIPISIAISLVLVSYILIKNINNNLIDYEHEKIILFLKKDIPNNYVDDIKKNISKKNNIISIDFYTEEESLNLYSKINSRDNVVNNLSFNPLPKTIIIKRKVIDYDYDYDYENNDLNIFLENNAYIDSYSSNIIFLKKTIYIKNILYKFLIFALIFLILILINVINNYIKIEVTSNKNKILIYRIIGARNSYIRREYMYFPIVLNFLCFLIGFILAQFITRYFSSSIGDFLHSYEIQYSFFNISFVEAVLMVFFIIIIGVTTCKIVINRFLDEDF